MLIRRKGSEKLLEGENQPQVSIAEWVEDLEREREYFESKQPSFAGGVVGHKGQEQMSC
jgi:hypothetical protein